MDYKNYFALLPVNEIGDELIKKKDEYFKELARSGRLSLLRRSFETFYRSGLRLGEIVQTGDQGEYVNICVNHYANLCQHRLQMTVSQRPAFEPKAVNTDSESMIQVKLAATLLESYERTKKMERFTNRATDYAIRYAEGFVGAFWNSTEGEIYTVDPETGRQIREGDIDFEAFNTLQVIRDVNGSQNWVMVRRMKNRHDLAAKYPELKDKILGWNWSQNDEEYGLNTFFDDIRRRQTEDCDDIPVYSFYHKKSDAVPDGRIVEFTDTDIVYHDGALPYRDIPLYRIAPREMEESIFGYSNSFDLLALQEAVDKLDSTILTNQAAFGVQNIAVPKGNGLNVINLSGGLNIVEFDPKAGPPIPLNLTATPQEVFAFREQLVHDMETVMGVNSVARGNPEANLKSGAALALVQSLAIQFAQGLQQSYAQLLEDVGTATIQLLQDYATVPRVALLVGKSNRSYMKQFKGTDLNLISRVVVDMGNPMTRTTAGRVNMADQLLERGLVQTPQQYIEVITTGRLEPMYESIQAELLLIRSENEMMSEGQQPQVIATDTHQLHIQEHKVVLASPESRANPGIVASTLAHIQEHMALSGLQQPQPAGAPAPEATPAGGGGNRGGELPDMPEMPTNPLEGNQ
jgi:hypothetical protein